MTEGTDSTSTDTYDIGTITFSLIDSEVICNPKNYESLTYLLNNIGLRDASASKNLWKKHVYLDANIFHQNCINYQDLENVVSEGT